MNDPDKKPDEKSEKNPDEKKNPGTGKIIAIRGSVVDAEFAEPIPSMHNMLTCGNDGKIKIEVILHLDDRTIRGIALTTTQGLALGSEIHDTGRHLEVPVGKSLLGRALNVFGEPIDKKEPIKEDSFRTIHGSPPSMGSQRVSTRIFETGIKVIDILSPLNLAAKVGYSAGQVSGKQS